MSKHCRVFFTRSDMELIYLALNNLNLSQCGKYYTASVRKRRDALIRETAKQIMWFDGKFDKPQDNNQ